MNKKRCEWVEGKEEIYIKYHDEEWGIPNMMTKYCMKCLS